MFAQPLVVLDFETTGLAPERGDRITEVGLVRIADGRIVERFQSLVNCAVRVPRHIAAYTGISQQMVDAAPPVTDVMRQVADFIGDTAVVSHNALFDQRFHVRECRAAGVLRPLDPFICSLQLARRVYPALRSHSLAELARALQLRSIGAAHRAAADAEMTAELMLRMGGELSAMLPDELLTPRVLRRVMTTPPAAMPMPAAQRCA